MNKPEKTLKRPGVVMDSDSPLREGSGFDFKKQIKELKARANYAEFELAKMQLEKEKFESTKLSLTEEISSLQAQHTSDESKIKDLNYTITYLNKTIQDLQANSNESSKEHQRALDRFKSSLTEVESVVSYRATSCKKYLAKIIRIVNFFTQNNSDPGTSYKGNLKKFSREVIGCIEEMGKIINTNAKTEVDEDEYKEILKEKDSMIEEYRKTLEKMREQMLLLRDRVKELEGQGCRKDNKESEKKIKSLLQERESLQKQVISLEHSLKEQSIFVSSLKEAVLSANEGEDIDEELAVVNQEILELQSSLERALI